MFENVKLESVNECGILVCEGNQVQFKGVVITEMRQVCGTLENEGLRFTIRMVRNWRTYMVFQFTKLGIALSVSTKTMNAIPSFGLRVQGLVLGFLKTVGLAVDWYIKIDIRNTSQNFVCQLKLTFWCFRRWLTGKFGSCIVLRGFDSERIVSVMFCARHYVPCVN